MSPALVIRQVTTLRDVDPSRYMTTVSRSQMKRITYFTTMFGVMSVIQGPNAGHRTVYVRAVICLPFHCNISNSHLIYRLVSSFLASLFSPPLASHLLSLPLLASPLIASYRLSSLRFASLRFASLLNKYNMAGSVHIQRSYSSLTYIILINMKQSGTFRPI